MNRFWLDLLITWFGSGLLKPAPGTWGSLAALPFGIALVWWLGPWGLLGASALLFAAGTALGGLYLDTAAHHDPGSFVLDEVVGQWVALAAAPFTPFGVLLAFVLFRLFDILKPWPASWIDQHTSTALGVMADDLVAGIYAAIALFVIGRFLP